MTSEWLKRAGVVFGFALLLSILVVWNSANDLSHLKPWHGGTYYIQMIYGQTVPSPTAYRILVPLLCFGSQFMGYVWIVIGMTLASYGLFVLTGLVGGQRRAQWLAMLLWIFWGAAAGLATYGFIIPDPLTWACIVWASIWALRGKLLEAAVVLIIGVMTREIVLMAIPFVFVVAARKNKFQDYLLLALPIVWLVIALIFIDTDAAVSANDTLNPIQMLKATLSASQGYFFQWDYFWSHWYMLFLLAVVGFRLLKEKRLLWFLLMLSGLFMATDLPRMIVFTFPLLIPLAGLGMDSLVSRLPRAQALFVAAALLVIHASRSYDLTLMVILTAAVLLIPLQSRWERRGSESQSSDAD